MTALHVGVFSVLLLGGDKLIHCLHAGVRCQAACCPLCQALEMALVRYGSRLVRRV